jgi:hypothetical protein
MMVTCSVSCENNPATEHIYVCFLLFHLCHPQGQGKGTLSPLYLMASGSSKFRAGDTGLFLIVPALAMLRQMTGDTNPQMEVNAFQAPRPTQSRNPLQLDRTYHHAQLIHFLKASHW